MRETWKILAVLFVVCLLPACSGDSFSSPTSSAPGQGNGGTAPGCQTDPTAPGCTITARSVVATTDKATIASDGFDVATITATVLDSGRAAVKGAQVNFSTGAGKLSSSVGFTDENGNATVKFSASPDQPSNGTIVITASVNGAGSFAVPVTITGTNLVISSKDGKSTVVVASGQTSAQKTVQVTAKNAAGLPVFGASVAFSLAGNADGTLAAPAGTTIAPNPVTTNINGLAEVTLTGVTSGDVWITATGLGDTDQAKFSVQDSNAFQISSPIPASSVQYVEMIAGGADQLITVSAGLSTVAAGTTIRFTTSIGSWIDGTTGGGGAYTDVAFATLSSTTGSASATLRSAAGNHGRATVKVFVLSNSDINDVLEVAMSPPVAASARVIVNSDVKTLLPSTDTTSYSTTVRAQVLTDSASGSYPIANVPVIFQLANTTGGGETLSIGYGTTDIYGYLEAKFIAGITPTSQSGVRITGTVAGTAISDSTTIEISGLPGSVALGTPRVIEQIDTNKSINIYNMSALVADGTGAAVGNSQVTLHFWPSAYYTGVWYDEDVDLDAEDWKIYYTGVFLNEDSNEDTILDPGEDVNGDGELTPGNSTAGAGPSTVTTGSNGAAPFNFVYLKDYANWVSVRARGTTRVKGTEATTTTYFVPDSLKPEVDAGLVHDSPFQLVLEGQANGLAMYPGTTIPWVIPAFLGTGDTVSATSSTFTGAGTGTNYTVPVGATPGSRIAVGVKVTNSGRTANFTMYVNVVP